MYLLDTDVVSVLRRPERHPLVARWYGNQRPADLYISVIALGEMQRGIDRELRRDIAFSRILDRWLRKVLIDFDGRILDVNLAIARRWGELTAAIGNTDPDLFIAATALEHDFAVVTRNVRDFEPTGVRIVNPFDG